MNDAWSPYLEIHLVVKHLERFLFLIDVAHHHVSPPHADLALPVRAGVGELGLGAVQGLPDGPELKLVAVEVEILGSVRLGQAVELADEDVDAGEVPERLRREGGRAAEEPDAAIQAQGRLDLAVDQALAQGVQEAALVFLSHKKDRPESKERGSEFKGEPHQVIVQT